MNFKNYVMRKSVFVVGFLLLFSVVNIYAQSVQTVFKTVYPELAVVLNANSKIEINDENVVIYRNQYQKLKEGYKEIEMFEYGAATDENLKLFGLKDLKQLSRDAKIDSLKLFMKTSQKSIKTMLKDKSKYGADSTECVEQYSNLGRLLKQKDYNNAYKAWKTLFNYYPISFKGVYIRGDVIIRQIIQDTHNEAVKANKAGEIEKVKALLSEKEAWIDTLLLIYDQRIKYFGNETSYGEPYLTGKKGVYIYKYRRETNLKDAYKLLKYSVEKELDKADADVVQHFFFSSNDMYIDSIIDAAQVVEDYNLSASSLEGNIKGLEELIAKYPKSNNTEARIKAVEVYKKIADNLTDKFSKGPYATCENLVPAFEKNYEAKKDDKDWLKKVTDMLNQRKCTEAALYEKCAVNLYNIEPSPNAAYNLGQLYLKKNEYEKAAKYYEEAYTNETDSLLKSKYYYDAAVIAKVRGQFSTSRSLALSSASYKPGNGAAYILIAQLYGSSSSTCGEDAFEKRWVYWLAVDKLNYAKSIDSSVAGEANSLISTYSSYYPNKEEGFMRSVYEGNTVTVGCWIQETTTARYSK